MFPSHPNYHIFHVNSISKRHVIYYYNFTYLAVTKYITLGMMLVMCWPLLKRIPNVQNQLLGYVNRTLSLRDGCPLWNIFFGILACASSSYSKHTKSPNFLKFRSFVIWITLDIPSYIHFALFEFILTLK